MSHAVKLLEESVSPKILLSLTGNSCYPAIVVPLLKQKQIYYSKVNERGEACCYDGGAFGLSFDVTDSELDALNSAHLPLMEQIGFAYERVA